MIKSAERAPAPTTQRDRCPVWPQLPVRVAVIVVLIVVAAVTVALSMAAVGLHPAIAAHGFTWVR